MAVIAKSTQRGCQTCKERKILCDRATPACTQCARSKRVCKGYGLQLSWPRAGDRKRTIVGKAVPSRKYNHFTVSTHYINVTHRDIEMHHFLQSSAPTNRIRPTLRIPVPWNPSLIEFGDKDLFQYFHSAASKSLTVFGHQPTDLGNILMRMAISSKTASATAVLKSLLALSSLHKQGIHRQAINLKISSLGALAAASKGEMGASEMMQHVAAGMLLCSFEVHQSSCTSSEWTWYIAGIKKILAHPSLKTSHVNEDLAVLTDWVYYHDVLARFTLRHWRGKHVPLLGAPSESWTEICQQMIPGRTFSLSMGQQLMRDSSSMATLELLSQFCDAVSAIPAGGMSAQDMKDYKQFLEILVWRLKSISPSSEKLATFEMSKMLELYKLSILVYLHRVSEGLIDQPAKTQQYIDQGFTLLPQLETCERQFPMYIYGCEARSDEQRAIVLNLMDRTEKNVSSRSLGHLRLLLGAHWAQDDLAEVELNYWKKMTSIISSASILPSLV